MFSMRINTMLRIALGFLIVALIAALLGMGGVVAVSMTAARLFFFAFVVIVVAALLTGAFRDKSLKDMW
jgi:uncharacterized membrane protein YtjA (UPF0391 family)